MAELDLTNILSTSIATPPAGVIAIYSDSVLKALSSKNDAGAIGPYTQGLKNQATSSVTGFAADTYLVGSRIDLGPVNPAKAGSRYHLVFSATKTAAGVAAPTVIIRTGTAGTVADAARNTFTFNAQTAVIDRAIIEVFLTVTNIGAAANFTGFATLRHELAATGFGSVSPAGWQMLLSSSGAFDFTPANTILGVSVNGGAAAAWTVDVVQSEFVI